MAHARALELHRRFPDSRGRRRRRSSGVASLALWPAPSCRTNSHVFPVTRYPSDVCMILCMICKHAWGPPCRPSYTSTRPSVANLGVASERVLPGVQRNSSEGGQPRVRAGDASSFSVCTVVAAGMSFVILISRVEDVAGRWSFRADAPNTCARPRHIWAQYAGTWILWSGLDSNTFVDKSLRWQSDRYNQDMDCLYRSISVPRHLATKHVLAGPATGGNRLALGLGPGAQIGGTYRRSARFRWCGPSNVIRRTAPSETL